MTINERQLLLLNRAEAIGQLFKQPQDPFEAGEMVERQRIIRWLTETNACPDIETCSDQRCKTIKTIIDALEVLNHA